MSDTRAVRATEQLDWNKIAAYLGLLDPPAFRKRQPDQDRIPGTFSERTSREDSRGTFVTAGR